MAEEMRDHVYVGRADDNRTFVTDFVPAASLPAATNAIYSKPAFTNGMSRVGFKVTVNDPAGASDGSFEIQERVNEVWVDKSSIGAATVTPNKLIEHNADEQIRECRIKVTFATANPDGIPPGTATDANGKPVGLYMEITGRRSLG